MPVVEKISVNNIERILGYAVKHRRGYRYNLENLDPKYGQTIESFETAGFIHSGQTQKFQTWSITDLGDEYYKDLFGTFNYYQKRIAGAISRVLKI